MGTREQNFLGQPWIPAVLSALPLRYRRSAALRLLAISPHYFVRQHDDRRYSPRLSRMAVLEAEFERNRVSRETLCDQILGRYLTADMTVLDFGCGPGFLAHAVSRRVGRVVAVDISRGVIACARVLHPAPNLLYAVTDGRALTLVGDSSIDLVYSFAVAQHLSDDLFRFALAEWHRVLAPGGWLMCHVALGNDRGDRHHPLKRRFSLMMVYRTPGDLLRAAGAAGFADTHIIPVADFVALDDDIGSQHVLLAVKPSARTVAAARSAIGDPGPGP